MSRYYKRSSECSKETVPNALWNLDFINCRLTGVRLEILSVFDVGARTCLYFSPRRSGDSGQGFSRIWLPKDGRPR